MNKALPSDWDAKDTGRVRLAALAMIVGGVALCLVFLWTIPPGIFLIYWGVRHHQRNAVTPWRWWQIVGVLLGVLIAESIAAFVIVMFVQVIRHG